MSHDAFAEVGDGVRDLEDQLSRFDSASPSLLNERELLQRMDTKLLLRRDALSDLLAALRPHYAIVTSDGIRVARYRTVYFDSSDLALLRDHLRGRRPRHKVRLRHYLDRRLSYVEIKSKDNHERTSKRRLTRPFEDSQLTAEERAWIGQVIGRVGARLVPQARVECRRICLAAQDQRERLTIDLDVVLQNSRLVRHMRDAVLVEVKQPRVSRSSHAFVALREMRAREVRLSKYACAMHGWAVSGRLDPQLHIIETSNVPLQLLEISA
jgi:hypothetical protein